MLLASAHRKTKKRKYIPPFDVLHENDWPWLQGLPQQPTSTRNLVPNPETNK